MQTPKFIVTYGSHIKEDVPLDNHRLFEHSYAERVQFQAERIRTELERNFRQMQNAGVLTSLTITFHNELKGILHVTGPQENIDALNHYLKERNLGGVLQTDRVQSTLPVAHVLVSGDPTPQLVSF